MEGGDEEVREVGGGRGGTGEGLNWIGILYVRVVLSNCPRAGAWGQCELFHDTYDGPMLRSVASPIGSSLPAAFARTVSGAGPVL
eukprot:2552669-Pyramimonas_sp.AAC.1